MRVTTCSESQPVFVLGADILEIYPDIIPTRGGKTPSKPSIDLETAHLVVPLAEIQKLDEASSGHSGEALAKLRKLFEDENLENEGNLTSEETISVTVGQQRVSILPLQGGFREILNIALTNRWSEQVTLLTNNDALALTARNEGMVTRHYKYAKPVSYTGRRDLVVPNELFHQFWLEGKLSQGAFERALPDQPSLVANEFVVMQPENLAELKFRQEVYEDTYFRNIGRFDEKKRQIVALKFVSSFPCAIKNAGQAIYAEALMDTQFAAVLCTGPAGSGKTYMATVFGLEACRAGQFIGVTVVPCENRSNLGALPGDLDDKMDPSVQPMKNALRNYVLNNETDLKKALSNLQKFGTEGQSGRPSLKAKLEERSELLWSNWFTSVPIEVARGRDFAHELALYDEAQDQTAAQMDTLIKRLGTDGKIVITGDIEQIHNPRLSRTHNGLTYAKQMLGGNAMVAQVCFTPDEVVRHPLVRAVVHRQAAM